MSLLDTQGFDACRTHGSQVLNNSATSLLRVPDQLINTFMMLVVMDYKDCLSALSLICGGIINGREKAKRIYLILALYPYLAYLRKIKKRSFSQSAEIVCSGKM